jgi:hypothetical protein
MLSQVRREQGQDLVEFALILPVLALLLFGIMEFGIVIFSYNTIADAAREGARYGVIKPATAPPAPPACAAGIITRAKQLTRGLNQDAGHLTITCPSPPTGGIQVVMTYKVDLIAFITGSPSITLRAASTMQSEE